MTEEAVASSSWSHSLVISGCQCTDLALWSLDVTRVY